MKKPITISSTPAIAGKKAIKRAHELLDVMLSKKAVQLTEKKFNEVKEWAYYGIHNETKYTIIRITEDIDLALFNEESGMVIEDVLPTDLIY